MSRGCVTVLWLFVYTLSVAAAPALARKQCATACREEARACTETQCASLRGKARRSCREACRGRLGCPAAIRTLAYVVTSCRESADFLLNPGGTALKIRRGDCDPVTVIEFPSTQPGPDPLAPLGGICQLYGRARTGSASIVAGVFSIRLGVRPDGSGVVFEVTDDFSILPFVRGTLPPEQEGFFFVRSDGSGLRRLGPASRNPSLRLVPDPTSPIFFRASGEPPLSFSPDGRKIVFTDLGPGPAGEDAIQIVTQDVVTGQRMQLTRLPAAVPVDPLNPAACCPFFVDNETILFTRHTNPDSLNPEGSFPVFTVKTDGTGLRAAPSPVVLPGSRVVPIFAIAGVGTSNVLSRSVPGTPRNQIPGARPTIGEVFLLNGKNLLQLTNFRRVDTFGHFLSANRQRAFFTASADPFGTNPTENCQLFSIGTLGAGLRQVTHFREGDHSVSGCAGAPLFGSGCGVILARQDPVNSTILIDSSCDPFGTNPNGNQLFAMRPDGSGLRQLTHTRGSVTEADGTVDVELPGPAAYSAPVN